MNSDEQKQQPSEENLPLTDQQIFSEYVNGYNSDWFEHYYTKRASTKDFVDLPQAERVTESLFGKGINPNELNDDDKNTVASIVSTLAGINPNLSQAKLFNQEIYNQETTTGTKSFLTIEYFRLSQELNDPSITSEKRAYLGERLQKLAASIRWFDEVRLRELKQ